MDKRRLNFPALLGALLLLGAGAGLATLEVRGQKPQFDVGNTSQDFGEVDIGQRLEVHFRFRNSGSAPLVFKSVITSCGCTSANAIPEIAAPGQDGEIVMRLNATRYRAEVKETATVTTNDPKRPVTLFAVHAQVIPQLILFPLNFEFGLVRKDDLPKSASLVVRPGRLKMPLHNLNWSVAVEDGRMSSITTSVEQSFNDSSPILVLTATLNNGVVPGPISAFELIGRRAGQVLVRFPITSVGDVIGPVAVSPDSVLWNLKRVDLSQRPTIVLEILRHTSSYRVLIPPSLMPYVAGRVSGNQVKFTLIADVRGSNSLDETQRVFGAAILIDEQTNTPVLAIPIMILGH